MADKKTQIGAGVAAVFRRHATSDTPEQQTGAGEPTSQHAVEPAIQQVDITEERQKPVKATYNLDARLVKSLKHLSVERGKDLSAMVSEAVRDLLAKYNSP